MTQEIEKKKHNHEFVASGLRDEIWDQNGEMIRYIVVEYSCIPEDANDCPDQATEIRILKVDRP